MNQETIRSRCVVSPSSKTAALTSSIVNVCSKWDNSTGVLKSNSVWRSTLNLEVCRFPNWSWNHSTKAFPISLVSTRSIPSWRRQGIKFLFFRSLEIARKNLVFLSPSFLIVEKLFQHDLKKKMKSLLLVYNISYWTLLQFLTGIIK